MSLFYDSIPVSKDSRKKLKRALDYLNKISEKSNALSEEIKQLTQKINGALEKFEKAKK